MLFIENCLTGHDILVIISMNVSCTISTCIIKYKGSRELGFIKPSLPNQDIKNGSIELITVLSGDVRFCHPSSLEGFKYTQMSSTKLSHAV